MRALQKVDHERLLSSLNFAVIVQTVESKHRNQDSYLYRYTFIKLAQNLSLKSIRTYLQCCLFHVDWISVTQTPTNIFIREESEQSQLRTPVNQTINCFGEP